MPQKTTKKTVAKKSAKPAVAKKPVVKEIPMPEIYCHCTKRKRNCILTCVSLGCFLLGFLVSQLFCCCCKKHQPKLQFNENGCVVVESIKCPKMLEELPMIDADHDNCITKAEMRAAKRAMRHHKRPIAPADESTEPVAEPAVVDAIAPVMED